jgi:carbohydrate-binding DOMON domain-containing protein
MVDRVETPQELLAQMPEDVPIVMLIFSGQVRDIFEFAPGMGSPSG